MGLEIGEKGYTVTSLGNGENPLAITLNNVEKTQEVDDQTREDEEFFLVGDFTIKNLGDSRVKIDKPDATKGSDEEAVENDELESNGDLLGIGAWFTDDDLSLEPGEEETQEIAISMRESADEYMIVFGFFDGNNKYYENKVTWTFDAEEVEEK